MNGTAVRALATLKTEKSNKWSSVIVYAEIQEIHHLDYIIQSNDEYYTCCGNELLNHFLCLEERQKEVPRRSQNVWTVLCKRL